MASTNDTYVTGLFPDRASAERAYESAHARGYDVGDVNMAMSDETRKRHFRSDAQTTELGTKAGQGAGIGGAIGGTVGAVAAAIAAIGTSLVLPGIGLVVAGPIAAALAGAGAGGAGRRPRRRAGGLGHARRAREALRRRHQVGRHPDGRQAPLRRRRGPPGIGMARRQRRPGLPLIHRD